MPKSQETGDADEPRRLSLWERIRYTAVQPDEDGSEKKVAADRPVDEVEEVIRVADDKERAIGLIAAPIAAVIGIIIGSASISYAKDHHQSVGVYDELTYALLALSILMLVTAWWRKRMYLGIVLALYGLTVFNLHYWGFGVPFLLGGAWYLVRAYRLQQELKRAEGAAGGRSSSRKSGTTPSGARPRANKRYTPPT